MRKYIGENSVALKEARCNSCGRTFLIENGMPKEEIIEIEHVFGYFSDKDGEKYSFDLCEACYNRIIKEFAIQAEIQEVREFL